MNSHLKFSILSVLLASSAAYAAEDSTPAHTTTHSSDSAQQAVQLNTIEVQADDTFNSLGARSEKKIDILGQDLNDVIRSSPGSFTQHDIGQGGIAINIRGMEGAGRVNTTIDGVSQNFYQSAPHGWNGGTTYVDENFISAVEIEKGTIKGAQGANALAGSANFRTISVDDLLPKGHRMGGSAVYRFGNNGYGKNAMLATAIKESVLDNGTIGILTAISGKNKYGYKNAEGEQVASDNFDDQVALESGMTARSLLSKIEISPNPENKLVLSYMGNLSKFSNNHTPLRVSSQLAIIDYGYDPLSDLINLKLNLSYNYAKQQYVHNASSTGSMTGRSTTNPSYALNLHNQSLIEFKASDLNLSYGLKLMHTKYETDADSLEYLMQGEQNLQSYYFDANWQWEKFSLNTGIRHERYQNKGYIPPSDDNGAIIFPAGGDVRFDRSTALNNPYLQLGYQLTNWLQLYASYAYSSRGPNVNEVMYSNNPSNPYSINPYLKPEQAQNRDIGFNIVKPQLFSPNDELRLKFNYFNNRIKDYIQQQQFYVCEAEQLTKCSWDDYANNSSFADINPVGIFHNVPDTTRMQGYELELRYDFARGYINFSYTKSDTDLPADYLADMGFSHLRNLPESYWNLDLGSRWLDNKLLVGMRVSYTGEDTIAAGVDSDLDRQLTERQKASPKLIDVYVKYSLNPQIQLFANVDNLTNRVYNYPSSGGTLGVGNGGSDSSSWANQGTGRGRSYYGGIAIKF